MLQQPHHSKTYPDIQVARRSVAVILVAITTIAILLLFFVSLTYFRSLDHDTAQTRLLLYQRSLNDTLERYQHLPFILAHDPLVLEALSRSQEDALNLRLASFARESKLESIYLMDRTGLVLASSNFNKKHSFVGKNYAFRPYFKQALSGRRGNYFGIGATTGRPGYFVSEPVKDGSGKISGVIVIKLDASELQQTWESGGENVLVSNSDGIIVLASNSNWLYGTIQNLSSARLAAISQSKQFGSIAIKQLAWQRLDNVSVQLGDETYTYAKGDARHLNWMVHYLLTEGRAYERAMLATIVFGSVISLLVGFATYLRSKRIQTALATSQSDRDQLRQANKQLEEAHNELERSSKLAALGQLSASVVHELGQPISALRNYLTAEQIGNNGESNLIFAKLSSVVDRMENITRQLRFFTKTGNHKFEPVLLRDVVSGCLELMQHDIKMANIKVRVKNETPDLTVMGNSLRLEQVLVNLLNNSLASMAEASADCLTVTISRLSDQASISIQDNGTGFGDRELSQLQEPFHTTRASGDGMGLGLSIASEIIKEHNGKLSAQNVTSGGAIFTVYLPIAKQNDRKAT